MRSPTTTSAAPPPPPPEAAEPAGPPRPSRPLGFALVLIAAGVLWLLSELGPSVPWEFVLPAGILTIGVLILTVGRNGRTDGLIGLGILLSVIAVAGSVVAVPVPFSAGDRTEQPQSVEELEPEYSLGAGELVLDLRDLDLREVRTVRARIGLGDLLVRVPAGVSVTGNVRVGMGELVAFDEDRAGFAPELGLRQEGVPGSPTLDLDLSAGMGKIEVTR